MFKVPNNYELEKQISHAERNYTIQRNDYLQLEVFTNEGERIIDPNQETLKDAGSSGEGARPVFQYLVDVKGLALFPMVGELKVEGLTLHEAEAILQKEYAKYYQQPFVVLKYTNKRVVVLGSPGGQLIPLINENVTLVEVLALAKGVDNNAKAHNIRILRGEKVYVADLSTIDGYLKNNMIIEPGDVVYIEPIRRPLVEGFRDYGPLLGVMTSLSTLILIILN